MSLVDLSGVEASDGFKPMPAGDYLVKCDDASVEETRNGKGQYIKARLSVVAPSEFENRKVFTNFNIHNPSEDAQRIGREQLVSFCECTGAKKKDDENFQLSDVNHLLGLVCVAHLKVRKDEQYGDSNEVSYFKDGEEWESQPPQVDKKEKLPFE